MSVDILSPLNFPNKVGSPRHLSAVTMEELDHAETTRKTHALSVPSIPSSSSSLAGRVTQNKKPIPLPQISQFLSDHPNYLTQIRETVALILAQISRISQKDQDQLRELKRNYTKTYETSADLTQTIAWNGLLWSGFALIPLLLLTSGNPLDRDVGTTLSKEFVPKLGEMWTSQLPAQKSRTDGYGAVLMQEWSGKSNKMGSDSSSKDQIIQLLNTATNALKEAARAN